tara:strand:- start:580 stop:1110 length:531 start_codon:yes stop_codon:yes gene_type:complete
MTNYNFFNGFASYVDPDPLNGVDTIKSSAYYYEHDIDERSMGNVLNVERTDTQIKMFHMTTNVNTERNSYGKIFSMVYEGECLFLLPSSAKKTIGTQRGTSEVNSRYVDVVKDLIDEGGVVDELFKYEILLNDQARDAESKLTYQLEVNRVQEVYGAMGFHGDGINLVYTLRIHNG